jgi:hypothetical protein
MENMDKGLTVPKWVLINRPKILKIPKIYLPKLSAQAQKFGMLMKKKASLGVRSPWPDRIHNYNLRLAEP